MSRLRLENLVIYDGMGSTAQSRQTLLVEDGRIAYVRPQPPAAESGEKVVDGGGKTALPGLFNCHVHMFSSEPQPLVLNTIKATQVARRMLAAGITTIRAVGGEKSEYGEITLRDAIRDGATPGPRMFAAGIRITMTGGFGSRAAREADGPDDLRKAAREQLKQGADCIKLVASKNTASPGKEIAAPELTIEEMRAAVEEVEKWGKHAAAHAMGVTSIKNALRAGVHSIEHGNFLDDESIELFLEHGAYLDPTFSVHVQQIDKAGELGIPAAYIDKLKVGNEALFDSYRKALESGVNITVGTDAGTPGNPHDDIVTELRSVSDAGATVAGAIHSATQMSARLLGIDDEVGIIADGKIADIVIVDGDLESSWSPLEKPWLVLQSGIPVAGTEMARFSRT